MTSSSDFQAKVTKAATNMDRLDAILNGDASSDVEVDSGLVPSLAKLAANFRGWSPVFSVATDGARSVFQVSDWVGGPTNTVKPATGSYVGATGLTSDITQAVNVRGATGADGQSFTVNATGTLVQRAAYDAQPVPFAYVATDVSGGTLYFRTGAAGGWTSGIPFGKGDPGKQIELQKTSTAIQWRYVGDASWQNLVLLSDITGPAGTVNSAAIISALGYTPVSASALAADDGGDLVDVKLAATGAVRQTVYAIARQHGVIAPETFGAVGDGVTDDTAALQAFLNALGPNFTGELGQRTYKFTSALSRVSNNIAIRGKGPKSVLLYAGATTTVDLLTFGSSGQQIVNCLLQDFKIESSTTMTAGAAIHARQMCRSRIEGVTYGGQDGNGKIFDGVFLNGMDYIYLHDIDCYGRGTGVKACGFSSTSPGAGLFVRGGKIGGMGRWGMLIGGGLGGVYLDDLDIISNGLLATSGGVKIDNSLVSQRNREFMFGKGVSIDGNKGYGIHVNDSLMGTDWILLDGAWVCSNTIHALYVQNAGAASIQWTGGTAYNNTQDGVRVAGGLGCSVRVNSVSIRRNGGWGVNGPGNVEVSDPYFEANGSGEITGGAYWRSGTARDASRYSSFTSGNPLENYGPNAYSIYNRVLKRYEWYIDGALHFYIDAAGGHNN